MPHRVDPETKPGILWLRLEDRIDVEEMSDFVRAHDGAIDAYAGRDYRVFCDIRGMKPLSPEAATLFERAKAYSAAHSNFRGSAVLVDSKVTGLQHQRTSIDGGVMDTELITDEEARCWEHLAKVHRVGGSAAKLPPSKAQAARHVPEKASAEKASAEKASAEKASAEKASAEKTRHGKR